jgi:hypothetical protein
MPGVIYEDSLTDSGDAIMGGTRVYFYAWEVISAGANVRNPNQWEVNTLVGVGHIEFGNDLTPGGLISGIGWGKPQWLHTEVGQVVVSPGQSGTDFTSDIAQYIRWSFSPGTEVHLYVFGEV